MSFRRRPVAELSESDRKLIQRALRARRWAYVPYSKYPVGCSLIDERGRLHTGCNVENASYSITICAERVAIAKMVSRGVTRFRKMIVATSSKVPVFPCGACLQAIREFGEEATIIAVDREGKEYCEAPISELYPASFWKEYLP